MKRFLVPAGTAKALVKAGKPHDLCVLPQADHFFRGPAGQFAMIRTISYFKEHLGGD